MNTSTAVKVLIVDDSELIRSLLTEILSSDPAIDVVGTAFDPLDARDKIKQLNPDVLTLDVEMPRMDGITFLKNLMRLRPMPVVMISTLTEKGAETTLQAMELGALDYISKPKVQVDKELSALAQEICTKVKQAARANVEALVQNIQQRQFSGTTSSATTSATTQPLPADKPSNNIKLIAIGASTGGTEAIKEVLCGLPSQMPPIVIVQHMPAGFTASYAKRLDQLMKLTVTEFNESGVLLKPNHVYIAHGAYHLRVQQLGGVLKGYVDSGEPVNRHKPSVDVLFDSVAEYCGASAVGVILTGMGIDGASGLGRMRETGALTIAQDEKSSVVWGMPRVAVQQGAAKEILPLMQIGRFLVDSCYA